MERVLAAVCPPSPGDEFQPTRIHCRQESERRKWGVIVAPAIAPVVLVSSAQLPSAYALLSAGCRGQQSSVPRWANLRKGTYEATATLRMLAATSESAADLQYSVRCADLATSQPVPDELALQRNLAGAPKATVSMIVSGCMRSVDLSDSCGGGCGTA